jgi:hypothetical protein
MRRQRVDILLTWPLVLFARPARARTPTPAAGDRAEAWIVIDRNGPYQRPVDPEPLRRRDCSL